MLSPIAITFTIAIAIEVTITINTSSPQLRFFGMTHKVNCFQRLKNLGMTHKGNCFWHDPQGQLFGMTHKGNCRPNSCPYGSCQGWHDPQGTFGQTTTKIVILIANGSRNDLDKAIESSQNAYDFRNS